MTKINVRSSAGVDTGEIEVAVSVFGVEPNIPIMHQAVVAEEANKRQGTSETKVRSQVRGGGAKPFRQKGTGRARQGSIRSPHMAGGGVVFGPHAKSYNKKINKKMRKAALRSALSAKLADGDIIVVESFELEKISTKATLAFLGALGVPLDGKILLIVDELSVELRKSTQNLENIKVRLSPAVSVRDLLVAHKTIMTKRAVEILQGVLA